MPIPTASVSMWAASDSRASEPVRNAATTSTTMNVECEARARVRSRPAWRARPARGRAVRVVMSHADDATSSRARPPDLVEIGFHHREVVAPSSRSGLRLSSGLSTSVRSPPASRASVSAISGETSSSVKTVVTPSSRARSASSASRRRVGLGVGRKPGDALLAEPVPVGEVPEGVVRGHDEVAFAPGEAGAVLVVECPQLGTQRIGISAEAVARRRSRRRPAHPRSRRRPRPSGPDRATREGRPRRSASSGSSSSTSTVGAVAGVRRRPRPRAGSRRPSR